MRALKQAVKAVVAYALYSTGLLDLYLRRRYRHHGLVLMYHRVLDDGAARTTASHPGIVVSTSTFARHLDALRRRFTVLSLDEFERRLAGGQSLGGTCLITFDDGWLDNVDQAVPLLHRHALPATIFLPVNYIGTSRLFWREQLARQLTQLFEAGTIDGAALARLRTPLTDLGLGTLLARRPSGLPAVVEAVAGIPATEGARAMHVLSLLQETGGTAAAGPDRFMSWAQAASLPAHGVSLGSHGAEHILLSQVPPDDARHDLQHSRSVLDERLGAVAAALAYPNGAWNAEVAAIARACGFTLAFTTVPGRVGAESDPLALPRINMHEDGTASTPRLLARLAGLF